MTLKHTPGPWNVEQSKTDPKVIYISAIGAGPLDIADLYSKGTDGSIFGKDKAKANTRLIAAAPDLLHSAIAMLAWTCEADAVPEHLDASLRAAITKAEGA